MYVILLINHCWPFRLFLIIIVVPREVLGCLVDSLLAIRVICHLVMSMLLALLRPYIVYKRNTCIHWLQLTHHIGSAVSQWWTIISVAGKTIAKAMCRMKFCGGLALLSGIRVIYTPVYMETNHLTCSWPQLSDCWLSPPDVDWLVGWQAVCTWALQCHCLQQAVLTPQTSTDQA